MKSPLLIQCVLCLTPCLGSAQLDYRTGSLPKEQPQPIYSEDVSDPWNQIFFVLYTRTVEARISEAFGGSEADDTITPGLPLKISTRVYQRIEGGDRAIEPLYPSFLQDKGVVEVLTEPRYSVLTAALQAALADKTNRGNLRRALMQSDLWAAYDILEEKKRFRGPDAALLLERQSRVLSLTAKLIHRLALTTAEIHALPENYTAAQRSESLPALFHGQSGWLEVQWLPERLHDAAANYRRAARVFVKPRSSPSDPEAFLENLRRTSNPAIHLEGVGLAVQTLLVNEDGQVIPSPLISAVQLRLFHLDEDSATVRTQVEQFDLSRKRLLEAPQSGGFIRQDENAPHYLPAAGNDYGFASFQTEKAGPQPPVLVPTRSRCQTCHLGDMVSVLTFAMHAYPNQPPVLVLDPGGSQRADFVATKKEASQSFRSLLARWKD